MASYTVQKKLLDLRAAVPENNPIQYVQRIDNVLFSHAGVLNDFVEGYVPKAKYDDVDAVVEQLEEVEKIMTSPVNKDCFGEECRASDCTVCLISKAIEIVKGGGVNE